MQIGIGRFSGRGGHALTGTFTLTQEDGAVLMETSPDFFFDGSPRPGWALFQGEPLDRTDPAVQAAARETHFGDLPGGIVEVRGVQRARIERGVTLDDFDTLVLWCFDVPFILGVGPIERSSAPPK